mgnify:CR=1 FL=1
MTTISKPFTEPVLWVVVRDIPPTKKGKHLRGKAADLLLHKPGVWGVRALYWFDAKQRLRRHWNISPGSYRIVPAAHTTMTKKELRNLEKLYEWTCPSDRKG